MPSLTSATFDRQPAPMFLSRTQTKARAAERAALAARVKEWVRELAALGPADGVTVSEIDCPDPGCPDRETVVLLMRAGRPTVAHKVRKPLADVLREDVAALPLGG